MKGKLFVTLCGIWVLGAADAIEIVSPTEGETVRQHFPAQVEYLTRPLVERECYFDGKENAQAMRRDGFRPRPAEIRWKDAAGPVRVTVKRLPDGKVFFAETVVGTNGLAVDSLEIARAWELTVADGQASASVNFRTEDLAPRLVRIENVPNARDLGGWKGLDGRRIRQGVLFRTSGLNDNPPRRYLPGAEVMRLDAADKLVTMDKDGRLLHQRILHGEDFSANESVRVGFLPERARVRLTDAERTRALKAYGFRSDVDLRRDTECFGMTGSPLGGEVHWHHVPYLPYDIDGEAARDCNRRVLRFLLDSANHPAVFHCIGGADRTGTVACLIEALLGVGEDDLWKDYLATGFWGEVSNRKHHDMFAHLLYQLRQHGGHSLAECARSYFLDLGFTAEEIAAFRELMLEHPEKPTMECVDVVKWERPKTTRRYLQGPLAERLLVAYREGKVVHGEMCHDKDWLRWRYVCQPAHGVWLVHGKDDEAFDFRTARMRMDPEGIPIHGQSWRVGDLEVDFEACSPIERSPSAHIRVTLTNSGAVKLTERIGFLVRNGQEKELVFGAPDIYRIYNPRVRSWKGLDCTWSRDGEAIVLKDLFVSFRGDSAATWDAEEGVLRFDVELAAGETKTYDLVLGRQDRIVRPDYEAARERTREDWRKELEKAKDLPLLEKCLLVQILQCYARANKGDIILPRQGGLQRWVWPWDQSYASAALTMLGYGEYVEMACDFYFGEYAQPDGRIGPFGMGWVNDTANVLGIFSHHCAESGNAAFWRKHRAAAERAFRWIKAERAKSANLPGQIAGLFPAGVASDNPKVFQSWGTTDLLNLQGLENYARAAKKFGDPAADEAAAEAADYRVTIARILDRWRRAEVDKDTFSIPYKPDGTDQKLLRDSGYFYMHPAYFAFFGFLSEADMLKVRKYMLQEGLANECGLYFHHPAKSVPELGDHVWYTTAAEYNWFFAWKRVGRDDLARQALDACLRYSVTDEYQVGERFHDASPWYFPWSPNASGAGRILQMLHAHRRAKDPEWRGKLPRPIYDERPELVDFYYKAWEIAHTRIDEVPGIPAPRYMDEAHRSDRIWIWDTCFMVHFCKYCPAEFPGIESLENFYGVMLADSERPLPKVKGNRWCGADEGKMLDFRIHHPDNPPLFAWTEYAYALQTGDRARLEKVYSEKRWLQRWYELFESFDPAAPQPFGSVVKVMVKKTADGYRWGGCPSGMDNTPRGRTGAKDPGHPGRCPNNPDLLWVDAIAQQGLSALYLSRIADLLGRTDEAKAWLAKYTAAKDKVNALYWDETDGFYYDILASDRSKVKVMTPASFWTALAEMPTAERAGRMFRTLEDDNLLGGSIPTVSLARNDPDFLANGGYWRGSVWLPTTYMTLKSVGTYGETALARSLARKVIERMYRTYAGFEPHTIWECYSPTEDKPAITAKTGKFVRSDFCGWSALGPIALFLEDVIGVRQANAFENALVCDFERNPKARVGVENYRFGKVVCSIVATRDEIRVESNLPFTLQIDRKCHAVRPGRNVFGR